MPDYNVYLLASIDGNPRLSQVPGSQLNFQIKEQGLNFAQDSLFGPTGIASGSILIGGKSNKLAGRESAIIAGTNNIITGIVTTPSINPICNTFILGGSNNINQHENSAIVAGAGNQLLGDSSTKYVSNFVLGGQGNCIVKGSRSVMTAGSNSHICNGFYTSLNNSYISCAVAFDGGASVGFTTLIGGVASSITNNRYSTLINGEFNNIYHSGTFPDVDRCLNSISFGSNNCICSSLKSSIIGSNRSRIVGDSISSNLLNSTSSCISGSYHSIVINSEASNLFASNRSTLFSSTGSYICSAPSSLIIKSDYSSISGAPDSAIIASKNSNILYGSGNLLLGGFRSILGNQSSPQTGSIFISDISNRQKSSPGSNTFTVDYCNIVLRSDAIPSTPNSFGYSGQLVFDNNYFYRHNGTNWTRTAMSSW